MPFRPPVLSYDDIRREAEEFLQDYHEERTVPVPIEAIVEFDFQLELVPVLGIKLDLGVDAFLTGTLDRIYVDQEVMVDIPRRFRFSLAHELAHYVLHADLYESVTINSVDDWRRVQEAIDEETYSWFEYQANAFAGLILVPRDNLRAAFNQAVLDAQNAGVSRDRLLTFPGRQHLVRRLANGFDVSEQVIEVRLEKDGLMPRL